jgi:hypothetical protein
VEIEWRESERRDARATAADVGLWLQAGATAPRPAAHVICRKCVRYGRDLGSPAQAGRWGSARATLGKTNQALFGRVLRAGGRCCARLERRRSSAADLACGGAAAEPFGRSSSKVRRRWRLKAGANRQRTAADASDEKAAFEVSAPIRVLGDLVSQSTAARFGSTFAFCVLHRPVLLRAIGEIAEGIAFAGFAIEQNFAPRAGNWQLASR